MKTTLKAPLMKATAENRVRDVKENKANTDKSKISCSNFFVNFQKFKFYRIKV